MGLLDKAKNFAKNNPDKLESISDQVIDKGGDAADKATGGKFADKIDGAQDKADDAIGT